MPYALSIMVLVTQILSAFTMLPLPVALGAESLQTQSLSVPTESLLPVALCTGAD